MKKIHYNKLIRDKIPDHITASGAVYEMRTLRAREFEKELLEKVGEEASALPRVTSRKELVSELGDVLDVIDAIIERKKISRQELTATRKAEWKRKGGFTRKLYLLWTSDTDGYHSNECRNVGKRKK